MLLAALALYVHGLRAGDDGDWQERWGELPRAERSRIVRAVGRGEALADRREAELAVGVARRRRGLQAQGSRAWVVHLILAALLVAFAIVRADAGTLLPAAVLVALGALSYGLRERQLRRLERAEQANAGPAAGA